MLLLLKLRLRIAISVIMNMIFPTDLIKKLHDYFREKKKKHEKHFLYGTTE